jgi:hypothetical protein
VAGVVGIEQLMCDAGRLHDAVSLLGRQVVEAFSE